MSKNGIRVEEFNIYSLGAEAVSYHLKDIHTLALQVTRENIGGLCLELSTELIYNADSEPYINIYVARGTKEEPENDRNLIVRPNDWFVILWDEIHLFKDPEFRSTFSFDGLKEMREYAEADAAASAALANKVDFQRVADGLNEWAGGVIDRQEAAKRHIGDPNPPRVGPDYHAGSLFRSEGQEPGFYDGHKPGELEENLNRETEEKTEFVPQVSVPIGLIMPGTPQEEVDAQAALERVALPALQRVEEKQQNLYPEGEGPKTYIDDEGTRKPMPEAGN